MSDLLQDINGDLVLTNGSLTLFTDAALEVTQRVTQRLRTFYGEWFLDNSIGVPWIQQVFKKSANFGISEALLKSTILSTPGVLEILSFTFTIDSNRSATINFQARSIGGNIDVKVTL